MNVMNGCIMLQSLGQFPLNFWSFTLKETGDEETQCIVPCEFPQKVSIFDDWTADRPRA